MCHDISDKSSDDCNFFQMNTASRIENSGVPNRIHCSQEFAEMLINAGKGQWLEKREDTVVAKGKGALQTFWVTFGLGVDGFADSKTLDFDNATTINEVSEIRSKLSVKTDRLIAWNATVLLQKLQELVKQRNDGKPEKFHTVVTPEAENQITLFVTEIAHRYHQNPFHNFEHVRCNTISTGTLEIRFLTLPFCFSLTRRRMSPCPLSSSSHGSFLRKMVPDIPMALPQTP